MARSCHDNKVMQNINFYIGLKYTINKFRCSIMHACKRGNHPIVTIQQISHSKFLHHSKTQLFSYKDACFLNARLSVSRRMHIS